ncbi:MAG: hypothetical protein PVJ57_12410 [Phycisphaerae bacterium]
MFHIRKCLVAIVVIGVLSVVLAGCASSQRTPAVQSTPTEPQPATTADAAPAPAAEPAPAVAEQEPAQTQAADAEDKAQKEREEQEKKAKEEAKKARERERKLAHLERDLETARLRLQKTKLDNEAAALRYAQSLEQAQTELQLAQEKFDTTQALEVPQRIAWSELNLQRSRDNLQNATEELEQLELMYKDDQFADQTKEIVISRSRRELERTQRDVQLREEEHRRLLEVYLPREKREQELQLAKQERGVVNMQSDEQRAVIDRQIALINAEAAITKLEEQLSDLREEIAEAAEQKAKESEKPAADQGD